MPVRVHKLFWITMFNALPRFKKKSDHNSKAQQAPSSLNQMEGLSNSFGKDWIGLLLL